MPRRSRDLLQLLPPGLPELHDPFTGNYEIYWSVYVRCANRRKLREVHLPALDAAIGQPYGPRRWHYEKEEYSPEPDPNEHRLVAVEQTKSPYSDALLVGFMARLYALAPDWRIQARLDASHPHGIYLSAMHIRQTPGNKAPAIVDVLAEFEADMTELDPSSKRYLGSGRPLKSG